MGHISGDGTSFDTEVIDVSRTVQSSDLFIPYRQPRVTLPTVGLKHAPVTGLVQGKIVWSLDHMVKKCRSFQQDALPFGGKYWGGPLTEYGGIGGLTFIGRQRVRDLEVTRSHRHYRSGFSKYLTDTQPYRLTELHLSKCRINDQILPAPLQADISKLNWQREYPWPDSQAYGTHRSIFEVFPSLKPEASPSDQEPLHNTRSLKAQPIGKTTQNALLDLNRKLYQKTLYQDSYTKYSRPKLSQPITPLPGDCENGRKEGTDEDEEKIDEDDEKDEKGDEDSPDEEADEDATEYLKSELEKSSSNPSVLINKKSSKSVTFNDIPQIMEDTIRHFEVTPNRPMAGVGPCWPPGSSYVIDDINGAQLVERADITQSQPVYHSAAIPTGEKKQQRLLSAKARLAKRFQDIIAHDPCKGGAPFLVSSLKSQDAFLKQRMQILNHQANDDQRSSNQAQEKSTSTNHIGGFPRQNDCGHGQREVVKLPPVKKIDQLPFTVPSSFRQPSLALPPAPLADCLSTACTRIPHRRGLRYKTEANKRYHVMYPDNIPDLRTNRKEGKKYFFYNFHSSVYRG